MWTLLVPSLPFSLNGCYYVDDSVWFLREQVTVLNKVTGRVTFKVLLETEESRSPPCDVSDGDLLPSPPGRTVKKYEHEKATD